MTFIGHKIFHLKDLLKAYFIREVLYLIYSEKWRLFPAPKWCSVNIYRMNIYEWMNESRSQINQILLYVFPDNWVGCDFPLSWFSILFLFVFIVSHSLFSRECMMPSWIRRFTITRLHELQDCKVSCTLIPPTLWEVRSCTRKREWDI